MRTGGSHHNGLGNPIVSAVLRIEHGRQLLLDQNTSFVLLRRNAGESQVE